MEDKYLLFRESEHVAALYPLSRLLYSNTSGDLIVNLKFDVNNTSFDDIIALNLDAATNNITSKFLQEFLFSKINGEKKGWLMVSDSFKKEYATPYPINVALT